MYLYQNDSTTRSIENRATRGCQINMSNENRRTAPYKIFSFQCFDEAMNRRHTPRRTKLPAKRLTLPWRLIIPNE